jgi:hypothetical protein
VDPKNWFWREVDIASELIECNSWPSERADCRVDCHAASSAGANQQHNPGRERDRLPGRSGHHHSRCYKSVSRF